MKNVCFLTVSDNDVFLGTKSLGLGCTLRLKKSGGRVMAELPFLGTVGVVDREPAEEGIIGEEQLKRLFDSECYVEVVHKTADKAVCLMMLPAVSSCGAGIAS